MAGVNLSLGFLNVATVANAWKMIATVRAPTNQMVKLKRVRLGGNGQAGEAKSARFRLAGIVPGSGTPGGTITPTKICNALTVTPQTTGRYSVVTPTAESPVRELFPDAFHPQGGEWQDFEFDNLLLKEGTETGVELFVETGEDPITVTGHLLVEE